MPDSRGKSHVRIAVFTILAIHVVLLGALLMAGCKKTSNTDAASNPGNPPVDNASIPPLQDSNSTPVAPNGNSVTPPANNYAQGQVTPPPSNVAPPALPTNPSPAPAPVPAPVDTGVSTATSGEHTIVKGDTFGSLAKKYNTSIKAITDANPGVQSSKLKIGQRIKVPASTGSSAVPAGTAAGGATTMAAGSETVHVVKNNDTLWGLAKRYGVSQNAIKAANGLKTGSLRVGQKLKIPAKSNGAATSAPAPAPEATPAPTPIPTPAPTGTPAQ
ncbi:MAG: Lytic transglycosylase catalytic [Verrucomicrobiales bacterium]|nr:Lytic transglycosylase catalytic [Verrucomicrobiales bacterium]